jgi:molecular chaperone GrpE
MPNSHESETGRQPDPVREPASVPTDEEVDLAAELARIEDRYMRALADLDNYRKRAAREIERQVADTRERVIRDWLEPVDSVERAIRMDADGPCAGGLRAVFEQMNAVLARQGVQRIAAPGERFDPERHEAIAVQPSEGVPDSTILAVERSGYALGEHVIRPAQVVVARTAEHVA